MAREVSLCDWEEPQCCSCQPLRKECMQSGKPAHRTNTAATKEGKLSFYSGVQNELVWCRLDQWKSLHWGCEQEGKYLAKFSAQAPLDSHVCILSPPPTVVKVHPCSCGTACIWKWSWRALPGQSTSTCPINHKMASGWSDVPKARLLDAGDVVLPIEVGLHVVHTAVVSVQGLYGLIDAFPIHRGHQHRYGPFLFLGRWNMQLPWWAQKPSCP